MIPIKNLPLLCSFFLFACLSACKKDDGLTKETQTGANTFSCLINGKAFTPKESLFSGKPLYASYNPKIKSLVIGAFNSDTDQHFSIEINSLYKGVGTYVLDKKNSNNNGFSSIEYSVFVLPSDRYYYTELTGPGSITITRSDNNIVSGTFEFVARNAKDANDRVTCTKGRFDVIVQGI